MSGIDVMDEIEYQDRLIRAAAIMRDIETALWKNHARLVVDEYGVHLAIHDDFSRTGETFRISRLEASPSIEDQRDPLKMPKCRQTPPQPV